MAQFLPINLSWHCPAKSINDAYLGRYRTTKQRILILRGKQVEPYILIMRCE
jgi:hypothetical protein